MRVPSYVRPALSSRILLDERTITFLPTPPRGTATRPSRPTLMSFDRRTGKLLWEQPYATGITITTASIFGSKDIVCTVNAYRQSFEQKLIVRLIDRASGDILQEIQPEEITGAARPPSAFVGYGTLVIFMKSGASLLRKR